jgi:predicted Zn-dependent protease
LIWLFKEFQDTDPNQLPSLLLDHPANSERITTLENHFRDNPSVFAKFNPDPSSATPLVVRKEAPERFLRSDGN